MTDMDNKPNMDMPEGIKQHLLISQHLTPKGTLVEEAGPDKAALLANAASMYKALSEIARIYEYDNNLPWIERALRMWAAAKAAIKLEATTETSNEQRITLEKKQFIDDGGSAFPYGFINEKGGQTIVMGMSLRDWLAGMALQGILANPNVQYANSKIDARVAYQEADAMIAYKKGGDHE
jgi:hypothetical protein